MASPRTPPPPSSSRSVSFSTEQGLPSSLPISPSSPSKIKKEKKRKKSKSNPPPPPPLTESEDQASEKSNTKQTSKSPTASAKDSNKTTSNMTAKTLSSKSSKNGATIKTTTKISSKTNGSVFDESGSTMMDDSEPGSVQDVISVSRIQEETEVQSDQKKNKKKPKKKKSTTTKSVSTGTKKTTAQAEVQKRTVKQKEEEPNVSSSSSFIPTTASTGARFSPTTRQKKPVPSGCDSSQPSSFRSSSERQDERGMEEERPRLAVTEEDSRFHDCIKEEDWKTLEKLLKKFDNTYYKRMSKQAREQKEKEEAEAAEAQEGDNSATEDADGSTKESKRGPRRLLSLLSSKRSSSTKSTENSDKSTTSPSRTSGEQSKRFAPSRLWAGSQSSIDPSDIVSPMIMVDDMGRTPLHLAILHQAPEPLLLELLSNGKKAALVKDNFGQLPLHYAVKTWQYDHVLEKIIKAYPNSLKTKDDEGRTPIGLSVLLARQRQEEEAPTAHSDRGATDYLWIQPALTKDDKSWQFQQEKIWSKVNYLLKDLMRRRKSLIPSEHGLVLDGLEAGANPNTINRLVSTTDKYLVVDDELAGTAIGLCIERQYCLDTLEYIMDNCRHEKTTIITDAIHKALNAHYRFGCRPLRDGVEPFGKQVIDWAKHQEEALVSSTVDQGEENKQEANERSTTLLSKQLQKLRSTSFTGLGGSERDMLDEEANNEDYTADFDQSDNEEDDENSGEDSNDSESLDDAWVGMDASCKQWWETLNHLIFFCAYGRDYKTTVKPMSYHLVHAALAIPTVPPSLIQLLLIAYPEVSAEPCPMYRAQPIHIACSRWRYDVTRLDDDGSLDRVLKLMLKQNPNQVNHRHRGRLPIHMALSVGQSWTFVKPFVSVDKRSVGMRDPHSKFFPFQMAALPLSSKNSQIMMRCKFTPADWRQMTKDQKKIEFDRVEETQERRQVGTIFELLLRHPDAVVGRPLYRRLHVPSRALRNVGSVSLHYLSFVYGRNSKGSGFRIRSENLKLLRDAIVRADIPLELETWWEKMKECIWDESNGDVPQNDDYLLHAALFNPESPPLLIELLLEVFPSSVAKPLPRTTTMPLHIAAGTNTYIEQQFESPYGKDSLQLVLEAYTRAARLKSNGRLPLHICLARGKGWKDVRSLVRAYPSSLLVEDLHTGLVPFQLMASFNLTSKENSLRYAASIERQTRTVDFDSLSAYDKAIALSKIRHKQHLSQLTCIFELFRHKPSAMTRRSTVKNTGPVDAASIVSSTGVSVTSRESSIVGDFGPAKGVSPLLAQELSPARSSSGIKDLVSPMPSSKRTSLAAYLDNDMNGSTPTLETPFSSTFQRPSLSSYLAKRDSQEGSNRSLLGSVHGGSIYNENSRPSYNDDDIMSSMHSYSTQTSADLAARTTPVSTGTGKKFIRRGKRPTGPTRMAIKMPDLGIDDDDL